jgi:hypothetical protein
LEDERRQHEGDAAMLALVSPVFGFVPFVVHNVYTYRIVLHPDASAKGWLSTGRCQQAVLKNV